MSYVKIHAALLDSSIVEADPVVRWVWVAMLVKCNRYGQVYGTDAALARRFNVTPEQLQVAFDILASPDPNSTTKDEDGRRIMRIDANLWQIVNYTHYRGMKDPEEEREKTRLRVAKHRASKRDCNAGNGSVTKSNDKAEAEAEAEAKGEGETRARKRFTPPTLDEVRAYVAEKGYTFDPETFHAYYETSGWKLANGNQMKSWQSACVTWQKREGPASAPVDEFAWHGMWSREDEQKHGRSALSDNPLKSKHPRWDEYTDEMMDWQDAAPRPSFDAWVA